MRGGGAGGKPVIPPLRLKQHRTRFTDITVAIVLPWLVFFLVISLFLFAYHDMKGAVWGLLGGCLGLSLLFVALGAMSRHGTFLAIGLLCLTSVLIGTALGLWLDKEYLQRYWELDSGTEYKDVDPTLDARVTRDATIIHFVADSFVDDRRTIGYVEGGNIICVAPVSMPGEPPAAVQYWAVGEDCCEMRSGFDCGTSRVLGGLTAITERPSAAYATTIDQAKAVYGIVGATSEARLVSFVEDPQVIISDIWDETLTIALIAMIVDLCMCTMAGMVLAKVLIPVSYGGQDSPFIGQS